MTRFGLENPVGSASQKLAFHQGLEERINQGKRIERIFSKEETSYVKALLLMS